MADDTNLYQKFGHNVKPAQIIFSEGDSGDQMFVIQEGKVRVSKKIGGREHILAVLGKSDFFGEMAIVTNVKRTATITAIDEVKLLCFNREGFISMINKNPKIALNIIDKLCRRLQNNNLQIQHLVKRNGRALVALNLYYSFKGEDKANALLNAMGIKVFFDPGGIMEGNDYSGLLEQKIHLIKPNEHEAQILTGVHITDFESAREAAKIMLGWGIENVVITHGVKGSYVFNNESEANIPIPHLEQPERCDATGCGDQTMAVLCAEMVKGKGVIDATKTAVLAGTLQFFKIGIQPLKREEVEDAAKQI